MDLRGMASEARRLGGGLQTSPSAGAAQSSLTMLLERQGSPGVPATGTSELSIQTPVAGAGQVNPVARKALSVLDRFGRLAFGPDGIGRDNEDIPWASVTALHTAPLARVLTESALDLYELAGDHRLMRGPADIGSG